MKYSFIIPVWLVKKPAPIKEDQLLDFTLRTIESIKKCCKAVYEIIIIDNGSEYGVEILKGLANKYIRNDENKGFAPAVNQGIAVAEGEFIIQSNNDIILKDGTLEAMTDIFYKLPDVGFVMPNLCGEADENPTDEVKYVFFQPMGAFWMTKPDVLKRIAGVQKEFGLEEKPLDENYKIGMFEDSDMWEITKGLQLQIVRLQNRFVFHQGNATWGSVPERDKIFLENQAYFENKHK